MNPIEIVIRTVGATAAVILATALARTTTARLASRIYGALFCAGVAAYLLCSSAGICAASLVNPLALLSSGIPFFFWAWTYSIMDDDYHVSPLPFVAALALICAPLLDLPNARYREWGIVVHSLLGIGFVVLALIDVLRTWRSDLIEARRRLRLVLLIASGGYAVAVLGVELFLRQSPASQSLQIINATLLALLLLGLASTVLNVSSTLRTAFGWHDSQELLNPPSSKPANVTARDLDQELIDKLNVLMSGQGVYRDASLSIATLAKMANVPEKRLREVINQILLHKNFSSYVNAFRLAEVCQRLDDSRNDRLPVLTLAFDAGFGSIVAFNRAFKEKFAMTPTEYRNNRPLCSLSSG